MGTKSNYIILKIIPYRPTNKIAIINKIIQHYTVFTEEKENQSKSQISMLAMSNTDANLEQNNK
jgi:hypothetical protein